MKTRQNWPRVCSYLTAFAFALLLAPAVRAYENIMPISSGPEVEFEIAFPFKELPQAGFVPAHVRIHNHLSQKGSWTIQLHPFVEGQNSESETVVSAGPGEAVETDVLLPLGSMASDESTGESGRVVVTGTKVDTRNSPGMIASGFSSDPSSRFVVFSATLATKSWMEVEKELGAMPRSNLSGSSFSGSPSGNKTKLRGSAVKLEEMPPDARAFSGIATLWLTQSDWQGLDLPRQQAITQWMESGGRLVLACENVPGSAVAGLPAATAFNSAMPVGFGSFQLRHMHSNAVNPNETANFIFDLHPTPLPLRRDQFGADWPLASVIPAPRVNITLIILCTLIFGSLVGPANLFWLAPARHRYRLFFTVPLFSLGASGLLVAGIFLQDGIGGSGARNALVYVAAKDHRLDFIQEQIASSGLLLGRNFSLSPEIGMSAILPRNAGAVTRSEGDAGGDWFRSHSQQRHTLQGSLSSRAAVTLRRAADGSPILLSAAASALHDVFYLDDEDIWWRGDALIPGRPLTLRKSQQTEFHGWAKEAAADFSDALKPLWRELGDRHGYFYAAMEPTPELPIQTLTSIRWRKQTVLCAGPCIEESKP